MKKFLVISTYAPPAISGTPLMMYNLLSRFPAGTFAILTSHFGIDNRVIQGGKKLEAKYFFFDTPTFTTAPQKEGSSFQKFRSRVKKSFILGPIFRFITIFYLPFNIVNRGKRIIKTENVELLFAYSDHGPALFSTYLLHRITGKPYYVHFYDMYAGNKFPWFYRLLARFIEPRIFKTAEKIFVMCEGLGDYYEKKYKRKVTIIRNSISIDPAGGFPKKEPHTTPFKIVFTGTIDWPQIGAIRNLIRAIDEVNQPNIQLYLYTPHSKEYLSNLGITPSSKIILSSGLPQEMPAIQRAADILFVGLSFKTKYPALINTSSPGKTYEYLISGTPLLVHAPEKSFIVQYARARGFAYVVDNDDVAALREGILKLVSDKNFMETIAANAWKTALENHDAGKTSRELQRFFE